MVIKESNYSFFKKNYEICNQYFFMTIMLKRVNIFFPKVI